MALLTNDMILDAWLNDLEATTAIMKMALGDYSEEWGSGPTKGRAVRIRIPIRVSSRRGSQAQPQSVDENSATLSIPPAYGVDTVITDAAMAMDLTDYNRQYVMPSARKMSVDIAQAATQAIFQQAPAFVGIPGVTPTSLDTYSDAGRILSQGGSMKLPGVRAMLLDSRMDQAAVKAGRALLNPQTSISEQYLKGTMGEYDGAAYNLEQYIHRHTTGAYGTDSLPLVDGVQVDGASVVTNGWDSGNTTIEAYARIQFEDVFMVDPDSGQSYPDLMTFIQTVAVSDTSGAITLTLTPPMVSSGPYKNVSALPADNAPVYVWGKHLAVDLEAISSISMSAGILMDREALIYASPKLDDSEPNQKAAHDKRMKLSPRVWRFADGMSGDRIMRFDLLVGFCVPQYQRAVHILSA